MGGGEEDVVGKDALYIDYIPRYVTAHSPDPAILPTYPVIDY